MTKDDVSRRAKHREIMDAWVDYVAGAEAREDRDPMTKFRLPRPEHIETGTRRLGALERRGIKIMGQKGFLPTTLGDGLSLLPRPSEITAVLRRFSLSPIDRSVPYCGHLASC